MLNDCKFIGNVTRRPETGTTSGGVKFARFTIACNERGYKKQDGTEVPERVEFIPVTAWRGQAEVVEKYVDKGQLVCVVGKFHTSQYQDAEGAKHNYSDIQASEVILLGRRREQAPVQPVEPEKQITPVEPIPAPIPTDGDLPF